MQQKSAPSGLSAEAKQLWAKILSLYEFDEIGLTILHNALRCFDRMLEAGRILKQSGTVYTDRISAPRSHPAVRHEHDARLAMLRHLRALGVDFSDIEESH